MNKIFQAIAISATIITAASCSDFLTEKCYNAVSKEDYLNNASEAENVLMGLYADTNGDAMYGFHLSILLNLGTDMEQVEGSTSENFRIIPTNAFPTTQKEIQDTWAALYSGIYDANNFIEGLSVKMENYSVGDKILATVYMAEARALRAWFYFELVRRWGNVVKMENCAMSSDDPSTFEQSSPEEIFEYIEEDLLYAESILPYARKGDNRDYRLSKGAVQGLLAKVYATWAGFPVNDESKWEKAALAAGRVINSGRHDLLPKFDSLWVNTNNGKWDPTESLIEVSFYNPTANASSDPVSRIGKWNGVRTTMVSGVRGSCAGNVKCIHPFVLEWRSHTGDLREAISVANYRYQDADNIPDLWAGTAADDADVSKKQKEKQNYTPAKWDIQKYVENGYIINSDKSNSNWYFLRYADVLLLYAEALNEWKGAPTTEAYAAINKVRRRAYGNPENTSVCDLPDGMTQEEFREAVRKERGYELAYEGHRRTDLVRWGIYYDTIQKTSQDLANWWTADGTFNYAVARYTVEGQHELLPIPQRDMLLCKKFVQNPNWN